MALCVAGISVALLAATTAQARTGDLPQDRAKVQQLAADIASLDGQISAAVTKYSQARTSLDAVRTQLRDNRRMQRLAYKELGVARATLAERAVALYKRDDVSTLDAVFGAADLGDLVTQLTMVRSIARCDRDVVRTIERTKSELGDRAVTLTADERTAEKLVSSCATQLGTIRGRLNERRAMLDGVRSDIRRLAAKTESATPAPGPTVEPSGQGGGSGPWWSLIQSAAASNGVSGRGMYRLMMIESGGSATVVGPGGYYGLFQYAPTTWGGSWNPWRSSNISDGAAQIKATALALRQGNGHSWWDPSYTWAFQGN